MPAPGQPAVHPRRSADIQALAAVLVRVHAIDGYPVEGVADPESWLSHPQELRSWTASAFDGQPVGSITLAAATPSDDIARIWQEQTGGLITDLAILARLFVDPGHRASGVGRLLVTTAVDYARSLHRTVAFDVMNKDRAAIRLYERMGARRLAEITHHYGDGLTEPATVYAAE